MSESRALRAIEGAFYDPAVVRGEVRRLEAALEAIRWLAKDAGLASEQRVHVRNLQEAHRMATAALAPDDNDEGEA